MKMSQQEALNILGIDTLTITQEVVVRAYRQAAKIYHPDRNPAGLEMMKLVNLAYETLKDFEGTVSDSAFTDYGEKLNTALNSIIDLGLTVEICGCWIWVSGDTRTHRTVLKQAGFLWASKKQAWYFRPANQKKRRCGAAWSMEKIRANYGSNPAQVEPKTSNRQQAVLSHA